MLPREKSDCTIQTCIDQPRRPRYLRTCSAAMPTMSADSPIAKSDMRQAVDETVDRFRESRVRKYLRARVRASRSSMCTHFCVRWIEESEPESL